MRPPKAACELFFFKLTTQEKVEKALEDIVEKRNAAITFFNNLKMHIISFADVLGADLESAIGAVASQMAAAVVEGMSKASNAAIELVLNSLLKILLSAPQALFSLIALPLDEAKRQADLERRSLAKAQANINTALSIIAKWTNPISSAYYYNQMQSALPFINRAVNLSADMEGDLDPANVDGQYFNDAKYNQLQSNIQSAISITNPTSLIDSSLAISQTIGRKSAAYVSSETARINMKYANALANLTAKYQSRQIIDDGTEIIAAQKYAFDRKAIETSKKEEIANAIVQSTFVSLPSLGDLQRAGMTAVDAFNYDMSVLGKALQDFSTNIAAAFSAYSTSQTLCGVLVAFRDQVSFLIQEMVNLLRANKVPGNAALGVMQSANATLGVVKSDFEDASQRYATSQPTRISSMEMSTTVITGNTLLTSADGLLNSTITASLIGLIDAADALSAEKNTYDSFSLAIQNIPDWDGQPNKWYLGGSAIPYINLVANATLAIAAIPVLGLSSNPDDHEKARLMVVAMNESIRTVLRHNQQVSSVLGSYQPMYSPFTADLKKILSHMSMLSQFSQYLSVASMVSSLVGTFVVGDMLSAFPNLQNCQSAYPDLQIDPAAQAMVAVANMDASTLTSHASFVSTAARQARQMAKASATIDRYTESAIKASEMKGGGN